MNTLPVAALRKSVIWAHLLWSLKSLASLGVFVIFELFVTWLSLWAAILLQNCFFHRGPCCITPPIPNSRRSQSASLQHLANNDILSQCLLLPTSRTLRLAHHQSVRFRSGGGCGLRCSCKAQTERVRWPAEVQLRALFSDHGQCMVDVEVLLPPKSLPLLHGLVCRALDVQEHLQLAPESLLVKYARCNEHLFSELVSSQHCTKKKFWHGSLVSKLALKVWCYRQKWMVKLSVVPLDLCKPLNIKRHTTSREIWICLHPLFLAIQGISTKKKNLSNWFIEFSAT